MNLDQETVWFGTLRMINIFGVQKLYLRKEKNKKILFQENYSIE